MDRNKPGLEKVQGKGEGGMAVVTPGEARFPLQEGVRVVGLSSLISEGKSPRQA